MDGYGVYQDSSLPFLFIDCSLDPSDLEFHRLEREPRMAGATALVTVNHTATYRIP